MADAGKASGSRNPLREPMMWLVLGLPAVVVVASFITIWLAATSGGGDSVRDQVARTAQVQTTELGADAQAAQRGLSAVLSIREGDVRLLPVAGDLPRSEPLRLVLAHPLQAAQDQALELQPDASGWSAPLQLDIAHDWRAEVSAMDGSWRIRGRLKAGERAVRLGPALPAQ